MSNNSTSRRQTFGTMVGELWVETQKCSANPRESGRGVAGK